MKRGGTSCIPVKSEFLYIHLTWQKPQPILSYHPEHFARHRALHSRSHVMDGALNSLSTPQIQQWLHAGWGERLHLSSTCLPFLSHFYHAALRSIVKHLFDSGAWVSLIFLQCGWHSHDQRLSHTSSSLPFAQNHLWISPFPQRWGWVPQTREGGWEREKIERNIFLCFLLPQLMWLRGLSLPQGKKITGCHVAPASSIAFVTGEQTSCTDPGWLIALRQTGCWGTFQGEKCKWPWSQRECYTRSTGNTLESYYRSTWVQVMALIFVIIYCKQCWRSQ